MKRSCARLIPFLLLILMTPVTVVAENEAPSVGVSGSFYLYKYRISPGGAISSPDIYVTIFNKGKKPCKMKLEVDIKPKTEFINISLSDYEFVLKPGESRKVYVEMRASDAATPGVYEIYIGAYAIVEKERGGSIAYPAAALHTTLEVIGESSNLSLRVVDPAGNLVPSEVRLVYITPKGNFSVARSSEGTLEKKLAPGKYLILVVVDGTVVKKEFIELKPGEEKKLSVQVSTAYISYFSVSPALDENGKLGFVQVVGVVNNLLTPLPNTELKLKVWDPRGNLEEIILANLSTLPKGLSEYRTKYTPTNGWKEGTYQFQMMLTSRGKLYAMTSKKTLNVTSTMIGAPISLPRYVLIGASLIAIFLAIIAILIRRRRGGMRKTVWESLE